MGTTPNPLHGDAEDPNDRRQNNIQMPQRTEGGAAQQGQQQGQQQEETTTTVTAVRAEDNVEIKETGVTVHLVMSYANWVAYKVRCIQSTTLGSQIIESATSCGCCSLAKLNKLKRWEIFIRRRVMPSFYLINIGLIAYVWITWRGDSYWDDDYTSYFYSFGDDGCSPTPAPTDVRRYYGYQFANYYYYSNSGGSSSGCDDGADADDDGQANNAWFTKIYGVFLVVAFVAAALFLAIDFLFWVAIDVRLRAAFDLSLSFEVRDGVNLGSQNTFLTISRTQRIELAETDLSTYALGAALEDKSEVKIMLFKKDWKAKYYGWLSQMFGFCTACFVFWLVSLSFNAYHVYESIYGGHEKLHAVKYVWWNLLWAHVGAIGVTLLLNVLSVIFIVAFGIVNIVSCGLLGCVRNSIYENTKKSIMDNVDPKRPDANRFTTVEY